MTADDNMRRLTGIVERLPEAERVDIEEWGGHPTFRVRGKNFVFIDVGVSRLTLKLPHDEAEAVVATEPGAEPAAYGLGRPGWVAITVPSAPDEGYWAQLEEWVRTSYILVAPKKLARQVLQEDGPSGPAVRHPAHSAARCARSRTSTPMAPGEGMAASGDGDEPQPPAGKGPAGVVTRNGPPR